MSLWREARKRLRTWVEGVACACAVTQGVLLDATTHLTWGVAGEFDDMEGIQRRDSHPRTEVFSALF